VLFFGRRLRLKRLLLDDSAVEAGVVNFDDIWVPALSEDVDLGEEALEALSLVDHVLDAHDLDRHFFSRTQVDPKLHPKRISRLKMTKTNFPSCGLYKGLSDIEFETYLA